MTNVEWAKVAGKAQGERQALIDVIKMAVETLRDYNDPTFARIILESILLAVEPAANDNEIPKARA